MDQMLLRALRQSLIFDTLDEAELGSLFEGASPREFEAGEVLFREGEAGDAVIVLTRGWVELCRSTPGGRVIQIGKAGPGEVLGEMALLDPAPRSATATALASTEAWEVPTGRFEWLLDAQVPAATKLLEQLGQVLCGRLRGVMDRIEAELTGEPPTTARGRTRTGREAFQPSAEALRNMAGRRSGALAYESELVSSGALEQPFPDFGIDAASPAEAGARGAGLPEGSHRAWESTQTRAGAAPPETAAISREMEIELELAGVGFDAYPPAETSRVSRSNGSDRSSVADPANRLPVTPSSSPAPAPGTGGATAGATTIRQGVWKALFGLK